jgi:hypothetical protein
MTCGSVPAHCHREGYGRRGPLGPHLQFRTVRESFNLTRLLSVRAFVIGTPLWMITHPRGLAHVQLELDISSGLHYAFQRVSKTRTHLAPVPSRAPALRQPILSITPSLCFLGHPTPPMLTAWSPTPALPERALGGFPRSACPFSVSFRAVLYAVSHSSSGIIRLSTRMIEWGQVPFWACLSAIWQVPGNDAYAPSSRILPIATCLGRRRSRLAVYPLSFPLSTIDNQSHAEGKCCLSSTWRVGIDDMTKVISSHLHEHAVVKVLPSCSSSLCALRTSVSSKRVALKETG